MSSHVELDFTDVMLRLVHGSGTMKTMSGELLSGGGL